MYLSIITDLVHNTFFCVKQKRRAHFQKLGAINEHFYNGSNKNVQPQSNQMQSILILQIVRTSVDFTLNSEPYQTTSAIHSYLKI